jgi:hypothetical protein
MIGTTDTGEATERCPRCGGDHAARQRCPLDAPPPAPPEPAWYVAPDEHAAVRYVRPDGHPGSYSARRYTVPPRLTPLPSPLPASRGEPGWLTALRVIGAGAATIAIIVCLTLLGYAIAALTQVETSAGRTVSSIAPVVLVAAMGLMYVSARRYAKVVFALLAAFLIPAGVLLMAFAPMLRQMNTEDLAEYRAFTVLMTFGLVALLAGIALGAQCIRWGLRRTARRRLERASRFLGSLYGVVQGLSGLLLLFALFFVAGSTDEFGESDVVATTVAITSIALLALVPGVLLTWHGISSAMGEGSSRYRPPLMLVALAAFAAVLAVGGLNMADFHPVAAPMPVLHGLAAVLPGVGLVALASRGAIWRGVAVRGLTWRQVTLAAAISMTIGVWMALYVEVPGSIAAIALLLVHNGAFAEAASVGEAFDFVFDYPDLILTENEQFVANLFVAAVLAPLSEEFGKSLGVRFMMRGPTTRAQAFALGAAAGAGFGFLEALLYGTSVVDEGLGAWWWIMLVRGGSTSLHVLATGLAGVAWWHWRYGRNAATGWRLFGLAVLLHAAWNAFAVTVFSKIFGLDTLSDRTIAIIGFTVVAVASLAFVVATALIARRIREGEAPPVEGTDLASMSAWLA